MIGIASAFDTLGYAKKLRDAGVDPAIAEAHAEAARDFLTSELVTKADLLALARGDRLVTRTDLREAIGALQPRVGAMIGAAVAVLAVLQKLW